MKIIKKYKIYAIIAVIIIIGAGAYFFFPGAAAPAYESALAEKGSVIQEVSVTGKVKPASSVDLAFETSGRVIWVNALVGDRVFAGQSLAQLYNADLQAQLNQAEATLKTQEAKLDELKKGTRLEEIQVYEVKVQNAEISLEEAKKNLVNKIKDAYTKSDDAIRNKADQLFDNPRGPYPNFKYNIIDSSLKIDIEARRAVLEQMLIAWNSSLVNLEGIGNLGQYALDAKQNLDNIKTFLDKMASAVNTLSSSSSISQTIIDGYKTDISTARTNTNTAIDNLAAADEKLKTAESSLILVENELALKKAGSVPEQISAQEAQVEYAKASVENYKAMISKTILRSPINGVITKQDAKAGEFASTQAILVSIISVKNFQVETNVPEADIAKIKINDAAKITLDAYGDEVIFSAKVIKIDPAETVIEGVSTYKTTLEFEKEDNKIKSGMTANIDILAEKKENVIFVPQRAVIEKDRKKIVRMVEAMDSKEDIKEVEVKTGLRGSDGAIEIIEGLKEGDKVVTFMK